MEEEIEEVEPKVEEKSTEKSTIRGDSKEGMSACMCTYHISPFAVQLQEVEEKLEEKNMQCIQLQEKCAYWQDIAESSSKDEMTTNLLERLKGLQ